MRLFLLELKRVVKTRSTLRMALGAIFLCVLMEFIVVSFTRYYYIDEMGNDQYLSGTPAINARNEMLADNEGALTIEKI